MPDTDYTPKTVLENVRLFEFTYDCCSRRTVVEFLDDKDYYVHNCNEGKWKVCCICMFFMKCDKKGKNRVGVIPNLSDAMKKRKIKFFMELKNFNKSHDKRTL